MITLHELHGEDSHISPENHCVLDDSFEEVMMTLDLFVWENYYA